MFGNGKLLSLTTLVLALVSLAVMLPSASADPVAAAAEKKRYDFPEKKMFYNQVCKDCRLSSNKNLKEGGHGEAKTYDDVKACARKLLKSYVDPHKEDRGAHYVWKDKWETEAVRDTRFQDYKGAARTVDVFGIDIEGLEDRTTFIKEQWPCDNKATANLVCYGCQDA